MNKYTYYPGCAMQTTGRPIQQSIDAIAEVLGIELIELEDWTCCGCPGESLNELAATAMAARNLALAEKTGLDLVVPCSCCYRNLIGAHVAHNKDPRTRHQVTEALAVVNLQYHGNVHIRNLIDVIINDIGLEAVSSKVKNKLEGFKVASYYGCHQSRPFGPDKFEFPEWQDQIVASLGAEPVFFPLKAQCCGGAQLFSQKDMIHKLLFKILDDVEKHGGKCISSTLCPLCFVNLDANQGRIKDRNGHNFSMPVVAISQLMGVAFGLSPKRLGLDKNISPAMKILKPYLKENV
jgi:heterodisulfide reductase subunit B